MQGIRDMSTHFSAKSYRHTNINAIWQIELNFYGIYLRYYPFVDNSDVNYEIYSNMTIKQQAEKQGKL